MTSTPRKDETAATRRAFLRIAGALGAGAFVHRAAAAGETPPRPAGGRVSPVANPAATQAAIARVTGGTRITPGRVKLELPPIVENGNSVQCTVTVASPMTPADHVKSIHVFTERNPLPNVIGVRLGPRAGIARFSARIRLADTQKVTAIAEMSDGSFWSDRAEIVVTGGACLEDT
jgi:sulfur-oxidizing protein SoxY